MKKDSIHTELEEFPKLNSAVLKLTSTLSASGNESPSLRLVGGDKTLPPVKRATVERLEREGVLELNGVQSTFDFIPLKVRVAKGEPMVLHPLGLIKCRAELTVYCESVEADVRLVLEFLEEEKDGAATGRFIPFAQMSRPTEGGKRGGRSERATGSDSDLGF